MALFLFSCMLVVSTVGMLFPGAQLPIHGSDLGMHWLVYFVLLFLAGQVWRSVFPVALVMLVYATGLELMQHYVPGRIVSAFDIGANFAGIASGSLAVYLWRRVRQSGGMLKP